MRPHILSIVSLLLAVSILNCVDAAEREIPLAAREVTEEATKSSSDKLRPLPVACAWGTAVSFPPAELIKLLREGHHVLPALATRAYGKKAKATEKLYSDYRQLLSELKALNLPVVLISSQWEAPLSGQKYINRDIDANPNVITLEGKILAKVSPFGPIEPWKEVGYNLTDNNSLLRLMQTLYPNPPKVIFVSNNEHKKLEWKDAEKSARFLHKYGKNTSPELKRKVVGDGWIARYRALQAGMKEGLINDNWREKCIFIGYGAFGPEVLGRWYGWPEYSLYTQDRFSPYPLMWDGGSPPYYTHDWNPSSDYKVWSPQIEFMNLVFMQKKALKMNPDFWLELSTWDGYDGKRRENKYPSKRSVYINAGQSYSPKRYEGYVQFGLWLIRPRALREYRGWTFPWEEAKPYFMAVIACVDRVYDTPRLKEFWQRAELVPNRAHKHPYKSVIPENFQNEDRWFLLDCSANPQFPWSLSTQIKVFSLALVLGESPRRQWLVYAHSPLGREENVTVTIPDYKQVKITSEVAGSFYLVDESSDKTMKVE